MMGDDDNTLKQEQHEIDPIQTTEHIVKSHHVLPNPGALRENKKIGLNPSIINSVDSDEDVSHDDGQNAIDDTRFRSFLEASGLNYLELNEEQEIMLRGTLNSISNEDDTDATLFIPRATAVQEREMNQQECCSTSSSKTPTSDMEICNRINAPSSQNNREKNFPIYAVASPLSFWNKKSRNLIVLFVTIVTLLLVSIPLFLISKSSKKQDEDSLKYWPLTITNICYSSYVPFDKIQQVADYMNERYNLIEKNTPFKLVKDGVDCTKAAGRFSHFNNMTNHSVFILYSNQITDMLTRKNIISIDEIDDALNLNETNIVEDDDVLDYYRDHISQFGKKKYGVPLSGSSLIYAYNMELFDTHNRKPARTWEEYNDNAKFFEDQPGGTISGSCNGDISYNFGYTLDTILASIVQTNGTKQGVHFLRNETTGDLSPAFNNVSVSYILGILENQTQYGGETIDYKTYKFPLNFRFLRNGACAQQFLTDVWISQSKVPFNIGVAILPGSKMVLDRQTGNLTECTQTLCPQAIWYDDIGFVNHVSYHPVSLVGTFSKNLVCSQERMQLVKNFWEKMSQENMTDWSTQVSTSYLENFSTYFKDYARVLSSGPFRKSQIALTPQIALTHVVNKANPVTFHEPLLIEIKNILRKQYNNGTSRNPASPVTTNNNFLYNSNIQEIFKNHLIYVSKKKYKQSTRTREELNSLRLSVVVSIQKIQKLYIDSYSGKLNMTFVEHYAMTMNIAEMEENYNRQESHIYSQGDR